MFDDDVLKSAKVIWEYLHMHQELKSADLLLVLGSHDLRVPRYAAALMQHGFSSTVIVSGGSAHHDDLLRTEWNGTEAEKFVEVLHNEGVDRAKILIEPRAKNTGENFAFSKALAETEHIPVRSILVVTKPYMERRAYATGQIRWPGVEIIVTSPPVSFEEYFEAYVGQETTPESILNIMVGDLQRIDMYGRNGFQSPQVIPEEVWEAYRFLVASGYTKHLLEEKE